MVEELHYSASGRLGSGYRGLRVLRKAAKALERVVYPPLCPACRAEAAASGLCPTCWSETTFLAPPACRVCGVTTHSGLGEDHVCDSCIHAPPAWSRGAAAVAYDGVGRRLVLGLKHGDRLDVAPLAADWMLRVGRELVASADFVAPTPLHWRRQIARRYNQAAELAREIAAKAERSDAYRPDLLKRVRYTGTQDGKDRAARHENLRDAIEVVSGARESLAGKTVLLIDDVLTTGATLSACAEACRASGAADVNVLVFARVAREAPRD